MSKQFCFILSLLVWLIPSVLLAQFEATLKNGKPLPIYAADATTGAAITSITPGSVTCRLIKNGVSVACSSTATEVDDATVPGAWQYTPLNSALDALGSYVFYFNAAAFNMKEQRITLDLTNKGGDALLVGIAGTVLTLATESPVNSDNQFNVGFRIDFYNNGHIIASTCIISSTNAGDVISVADDLSGNPGVGAGIPYKIVGDHACFIRDTQIQDGALKEAKFGSSGTFAAGSTTALWNINVAATTLVSGQQICHVPTYRCVRCNSYSYSLGVGECGVIADVAPTNGDGYVIGGLTGSIVDFSQAALAQLFTVDTGQSTATAINNSVIGEILDGAGVDPWSIALPGAYGAGTAGKILGDSLTAMVAGVWNEAIAGHLAAGSTGAALNVAGSGSDPWTIALPGAYGAGTAGKIIGDNLNATVSSRLADANYIPPTNFSALSITTGGQVAARIDPAGITADSFAPGVIGHQKTAQAVTTKSLRMAAAETYGDDELADHHAMLITSATTGMWQARCICRNLASTDTATLCDAWKTLPTGVIKYSVVPDQNCNRAKWPLSR